MVRHCVKNYIEQNIIAMLQKNDWYDFVLKRQEINIGNLIFISTSLFFGLAKLTYYFVRSNFSRLACPP